MSLARSVQKHSAAPQFSSENGTLNKDQALKSCEQFQTRYLLTLCRYYFRTFTLKWGQHSAIQIFLCSQSELVVLLWGK